ncbi:MAG TPA: amino acid adenylation domain-containing protein [Chloroflexi bacterium]|nr:amino acid adenylation domain-containing protein [Chloroflexota bacterium]
MSSVGKFTCAIFGETTLPIQCAEILLEQGHTIKALVSPDADAARWAKERGLPFFTPDDNILTVLQRQPVDYLFSIVNHRILPLPILNAPRQLAINYHDGPLPRYAGLHVTSWAILNGETRHGVTWHIMTEQADAGDILKQGFFDISPADTALTLNAKSYDTALRLFRELIDDLSHSTGPGQARAEITRTPQDLSQRSYFPRRQRPPAAGVIDWSRSALDIDALARALTFGAYPNPLGLPKFLLGDETLAVGSLEVLDAPASALPGVIVAIAPNALTVAAADRNAILRRITALDGQSLPSNALTSRYNLRPGDLLPALSPDLAHRLTQINAQLAPRESFWRKRLLDLQPLVLPFSEKQVSGWAGGQVGRCDFFAHLPTCLPAHSLIAAFLARLNDQYTFDLAFTYPELRQTVAGLEAFFAPYIPWRITLDPLAPLDSLQEEIAALKKRHTYPLDLIARYPELRSDPARFTLPVAVELLEDLESLRSAPGAYLTVGIAQACTESGRSDGQSCRWLLDPRVFSPDDAAQLKQRFEIFLDAAIRQPDAPLSQLPILTPAEERQLLLDWNDTQRDYPADILVHHLFEAQTARAPEAIAVTFEDQSLTYAELNRRAGQLARQLQSLGVEPDIPVGICLERSIEMAVAVLGVLKAGGVCVPLDPGYPEERLAFMREDAGINALLTQQENYELRVTNYELRTTNYDSVKAEKIRHSSFVIRHSSLVYILYTSGSTGRPKGVAMPHRSLANLIQWHLQDSPLSRPARTLQFASLSFDVAFQEMFSTWAAGGTLVLLPEETRRDSMALLRFLAERRIERLFLPFVALNQLAEAARSADVLPANLRDIVTAGEQLQITPAIVELFNRLPNCALHNHYGPTESHVVTVHTLTGPADTWPALPPIGRPIANTQIYLLDRFLQPVPIGFPGELHIGGFSLAREYLNRPELTAERFSKWAGEQVSRWAGEQVGRGEKISPTHLPTRSPAHLHLYKTGDIARYRPDGSIEFLGRVDNQVKIRGFRVELGEIEAALARHPAVSEAVVALREDRPGDKRLVAYIVGLAVSGQRSAVISVLREFLVARLPDYMIPAAFVFLDAFPLTASNKVDRRALPAPDSSRAGLSQEFATPRTPTEANLAEIWAAVLGVEQVGIHDDFFELGGHSLLATQLISRLRDAFQVELPLRRLFSAPTVAGLAEYIETVRWAAYGRTEATSSNGELREEGEL